MKKINGYKKLRMKYTKAFGIDKNCKHLKAKNISDDYLKHIIFFLAEGKGGKYFIEGHKERLSKIFLEAYKRNILPDYGILNLQARAEYMFGFSDTYPNMLYTGNNELVKAE